MPAGAIKTTLSGPKAVILTPAVAPRVPVPSFGKALENTARWSVSALTHADGWKRAIESGIGGEALAAASMRGLVSLVPTALAVKAVSFLLIKGIPALLHADTPEAKRLHAAIGNVAGSVALIVESALPADAAAAADAVRRFGAMPKLFKAWATWQTTAMKRVVNQTSLFIVGRARDAVQTRTAGLELGGSTMQGVGASIDLGGVAVGFPGAGFTSFAGPTNVIDGAGSLATGAADTAMRAGVKARSAEFEAWAARLLVRQNELTRESTARALAFQESVAEVYGAAPDAPITISLRRAPRSRLGAVDIPDPVPLIGEDYGPRGMAFANIGILNAPDWQAAVDVSNALASSLEAGVAEMLGGALAKTKTFADGMETTTKASLDPARIATDSLNDAFALDVQMIDRVTAGSERAARAKQIIEMSTLALSAAIQGGIAFSRAVAEVAAGDAADAALHFTAAGLYAVAAGLAIGYGGSARRASAQSLVDNGAQQYGSIADLLVIAPGYSDPERIAALVAGAIDGTGIREGATSVAHSSAQLSSIVDQVVSALAQHYIGRSGQDAALGWAIGFGIAGPVGGIIGSLVGRFGGGEVRRDTRRVSNELRRFGRHFGF